MTSGGGGSATRVRDAFPRRVRVMEHVWIPMADGARLAARIWLPEDAERRPVPAILEYIPYRKNDGTAVRDSLRHPYFAGHGYASVRVDLRGSGDSDGLLLDEYLPQEQDDALEVIAWLSRQPWCTGAVGMFGKSWGGFNGLQVAARRPAALEAVISLYSTDDRYADDVHYMGGCVLAAEMLPWASTMLANNASPPDPAVVGERWRAMWLERLERTPPFAEAWLSHQRRDGYWKHGSVCEDYAAIACPVYAMGGWADGYTNAVLRLLEGLRCPRKGLIGPWGHEFPDIARPGPAIGFLQECLRWWDYWLKGMDNGIMAEPMLRVWLQDADEARDIREEWPGRWVAEPGWPSPGLRSRIYRLSPAVGYPRERVGAGALSPEGGGSPARADPPAPGEAPGEGSLTVRSPQWAGRDAGVWCPHGNLPGELPADQRAEDGLALAFDSAPLEGPLAILGFPEVTLTLAADRPRALVAVRLCDVAPHGGSTLITRGLLNLAHRDGHEHPTPLTPGERHTVTVRLNAAGYRIPAGHRLRVAVSPTYWPFAWPSPQPVTLAVITGQDSRLALPVRDPRPEDVALPPRPAGAGAPPPEVARPLAVEVLRAGSGGLARAGDAATGRRTVTVTVDGGRVRLPDGLEYDSTAADAFTLLGDDPLSARVDCRRSVGVGRGAWQTRVETRSTMTAGAAAFRLTNTLEAFEGDVRIFAKTWDIAIPRDLV